MNPITSWPTLVTAIQSAGEDQGADFLSFLPVAIDNAENTLAREIDTLNLIYTSTITASVSTPLISKPSGHKFTKKLVYVDPNSNRTVLLRKKSTSYLTEYWPQETSVGTPKYYSDEDGSTLKIAPCVSSQANIKITGVRRPSVLSSANPTNVFVTDCPDALFHAVMIEIAIWQRNDVLLSNHSQKYIAARDGINNEARRQRRDDGSPVKNPLPGENTIYADAIQSKG